MHFLAKGFVIRFPYSNAKIPPQLKLASLLKQARSLACCLAIAAAALHTERHGQRRLLMMRNLHRNRTVGSAVAGSRDTREKGHDAVYILTVRGFVEVDDCAGNAGEDEEPPDGERDADTCKLPAPASANVHKLHPAASLRYYVY